MLSNEAELFIHWFIPTSTWKALGMEMTHPGVCAVLGPQRCKRFSAYVEEGIIKVFNLAEAEDDPAGDAHPEISCVEQVW
jgi:peroxiredoxin